MYFPFKRKENEMGLDVSLSGKTEIIGCECPNCGHKHTKETTETLFSGNITHNLEKMAKEAGISRHIWYPEEIGITKAYQLTGPLRKGLTLMKAEPKRFKKFDPPNKWGSYADFVPWIEKYLEACEEHPEADVSVSR
jgi:hypothetical protein